MRPRPSSVSAGLAWHGDSQVGVVVYPADLRPGNLEPRAAAQVRSVRSLAAASRHPGPALSSDDGDFVLLTFRRRLEPVGVVLLSVARLRW
jgi:hypothetical protein